MQELRDPEKAKQLSRFFKTGKGEYGEGDIFYGLTVPQSRKIVHKYNGLSMHDILQLLHSQVHEERLIALLILVEQFQKGNTEKQDKIYTFYLANTKFINNWDLVDVTVHKIIGEYLYKKQLIDPACDPLHTLIPLAKSPMLWERRIAMIATFAFLYHGISMPTYAIAEVLITDTHDLIQKAVGWMLREAGKRVSQSEEEAFLKKYYKKMPRTALRYAIERFDETKRKEYLRGEI